MIEPKDLPREYVSIRQVWLMQINRCNEAISNRAKPDSSEEAYFQQVGQRTVVYAVKSLYFSLVDYGEAKVKTECEQLWDEKFYPKIKTVTKWDASADIHERFFEAIIEVLNKYGMLFETQPKGYSNVEMRSVQ
jgi:hypothetical protein